MAHLNLTMLHIRQHVGKCTPAKSGFTCRCPAHDDRHASLSVSQKHDRIVIHCHAGCAPEAILDQLGLGWEDMFADSYEGRKRTGERRRPERTPAPVQPKPEPPPPDYTPLLEAVRRLPCHRQALLMLADHLGARPESREAYADAADAVGVVWLSRRPSLDPHLPHHGRGWQDCWGIPERNAEGQVIGISRRFPDGSKGFIKGGKRGLTFAPSMLTQQGAVYLPEGASDTICLVACGLRAVGRPSNTGGVNEIADLFAFSPTSPDLVILGENDHKVDGRCPGREGMDKVGLALGSALPSHNVWIAMIPAPAKDARQWLAGRSGQAAGLALVSLILAVKTLCPRHSIKSNKEEISADSPDCLPDLLAGLPRSPSACACQRGGSSLLQHVDQTDRKRVARYACDCWQCCICRLRLAVMWATHLAGCAGGDIASGRTLRTLETTTDRFEAVRKTLSRRGANWAALEVGPGLLLVLLSLPEGVTLDGSEAVTLLEAGVKLVAWAKEVRTWPEPFSSDRKRTHPARVSKEWRLPKKPVEKQWQQLIPLQVKRPDSVLQVLSCHGVRPLAVAVRISASDYPASPSLGWLVEWRTDAETSERIWSALRDLDDAPKSPPSSDNEDIPW